MIGGSRGGPMRLSILQELARKPRNTNELSKILGIDYKTAEYHLRVLKSNSLVVQSGASYDSKFSVSPFFKNWAKANKVWRNNRK